MRRNFPRLSGERRSNGRTDSAARTDQERWMRAQGPISTSLFEFLQKENRDSDYDAFVFFGY